MFSQTLTISIKLSTQSAIVSIAIVLSNSIPIGTHNFNYNIIINNKIIYIIPISLIPTANNQI